MKKFLAIAALGAVVAGAQAVTLTGTFDVTGIASWDEEGSFNNEAFLVDLDAAFGDHSNYVLTGIGWDVNITGISPSWQSELVVSFWNTSFTNGLYLTPGFGADAPGTGNFTSGGVVNLVDLGLDVALDSDDTLYMEFFEGFDDVLDQIDGTWNSGNLTLQFEAAPVPEPATMAVLGLGAAALMRRRRNK